METRFCSLYQFHSKENFRTRSRKRFVSVNLRSGKNGDGPTLDPEVRNSLRASYLKPLRDAERAMTTGCGSHLSQILQHTKEITEVGEDFDPGEEAPDVQN